MISTYLLGGVIGFVCTAFLATIYTATLTYYFQTKEYRFDRFISFLRENGLRSILWPNKIHKPKKSIRNIFIAGFSIMIFLIVTVITDSILYWWTVFILVPIGVILTEPIAIAKREISIALAKRKLTKFNPLVIGITGSYGKTTTKDFLHTILSTQFETQKTFQNYNTNVGVAISINKSITAKTKFFIAEIGAYKIGEIKNVTAWVKPKIGILTALGNQHIDLFGSKENLITAKKELLQSLPEDGTAYVNSDVSEYKTAIKDLKCSIVMYSIKNQKADVYIKDNMIVYKNQQVALNTKLIGNHNLLNLLPCVAIALDLGISIKHIEQAISKLKNDYGKLSLHTGLNKSRIIYDGKNSNYNGFLAALETLADVKAENKFVISKGIIELGEEKQKSYVEILKKINQIRAKLITTDKLFLKLDKHNIVKLATTEKDLSNLLKSMVDNGSALLVEGRFPEPFIKSLGISDQQK